MDKLFIQIGLFKIWYDPNLINISDPEVVKVIEEFRSKYACLTEKDLSEYEERDLSIWPYPYDGEKYRIAP